MIWSKDNFVKLNLFRLLGLYFQIRDDYANLRLASYAVNKSFAEDLTEGLIQTSIYETGLK